MCSIPYYNENQSAVESGALIGLTAGPDLFCGNEHPKRNVFVYDTSGSVIANTSRPRAMLRDIYNSDLRPGIAAELPQWRSVRAGALRSRFGVLLLINAVCKPALMKKDSFLRVTDFTDQAIARVINERGLNYTFTSV